jgi:hypothetical protein
VRLRTYGPCVRLLRSATGKSRTEREAEEEDAIVNLSVNFQAIELIITVVPVIIMAIQKIHGHGKRLGAIEAKLNILYDDVRALEKYN